MKITKNELLAIIAAAGVSSGATAIAATLDQNSNSSFSKVERSGSATYLGDSACGKGSCGKDEKGAAAAKEKHGKKESKKEAKPKEEKKEEKKSGGK